MFQKFVLPFLISFFGRNYPVLLHLQENLKYPLAYEPEILNHAEKYGHGMTNGNIAAIEFGTTSVALAYISRGDKEVSMLMLYKKNWGIRVPNTILLRKDGASLCINYYYYCCCCCCCCS